MEPTAKNSILKRPPVVSIMGHIDHGKSTLLDYVRKTNIVATEAGGITQRLSAYEVIHKTADEKEEKITFLDTPGHEAFAAMRISGTAVADVAVLVVSAEDGVKKQTLEALSAINDAKVPFIIAINKIDKPDANIERTKNSLVENGIYIEGYGGTIPFCLISAKTGKGIPELMDLILLVAELSDLKGDINKLAEGLVIEAHLDKQKGITATLIIKDGSLKSGLYIVSGESFAPTRIMENFLGKNIKEATFSSPVQIIGFDKMPEVGKPFKTFDTKKEAEEYILNQKNAKVTEKKSDEIETDDISIIRLMLKAEVAGSLAAMQHEIAKIKSDKVKIKIINQGIGNITENDIKMASGRNPAIIIGFDVSADSRAKDLAERQKIEIKSFDIIYKISEWLSEEVVKKTPKVMVEEVTALAKVLKYFSSMKDKHIIGARVEKGEIHVGNEVRIMRRDEQIGTGKIKEIQKNKDKVSDVHEGIEFGCQMQSDIIPAPGDKLEIFRVIEQ